MTGRPKIAIIDSNTLSLLGLKQLLLNVLPIMTIDTYGSFAELESNDPEQYFHYVVEAGTYQLLADDVRQLVLLVFVTLDDEARLQLCGNLHIIISIDTQDILNDVARTLHIDAVGGNFESQT